MGRIVGIDLGTTNSLVAYLDPQTKTPKCIAGPHGSTLCPSIVSLDPDGNIIVGEAARRRLLTQPERTIYSVKRLMGRGVKDVQDELKLFPFRLDPSSSNVIRVRLGEKVFTPPEISAFILRELRNWAEALFGEVHAFNSLFPAPNNVKTSATSFSMQVGGGVDIAVGYGFNFRPVDVYWVHSSLPNNANNIQNNFRIGLGASFRK